MTRRTQQLSEHGGDPEENELDEKFEAVMSIISVSQVNQHNGVPEIELGENPVTVPLMNVRCGSCNQLVGREFAFDVWQSVC